MQVVVHDGGGEVAPAGVEVGSRVESMGMRKDCFRLYVGSP